MIAPIETKKFSTGIAELAKEKAIQVIALSLPFHQRGPFRKLKLPVPPAVLTHSELGTFKLGEYARTEFSRRWPQRKNAYLILIHGRMERFDSRARVNNFRLGFERYHGHVDYVVAMPCNWQRHTAFLEMQRLIDSTEVPIDVVFAANDEMALGAWDALRDSNRNNTRTTAHTMVYGFDAIAEARSLIGIPDYHLRGTIEQNLVKMAEALTDLVGRYHRGEQLSHEENDTRIEPKLVVVRSFSRKADWPNNVPELNLGDGSWVTDIVAAAREGKRVRLLADYRKKSQRATILEDNSSGIDRFDRVWRLSQDGRIYYLVSTLKPRRAHKEIKRNQKGGKKGRIGLKSKSKGNKV